MTKPSPRLFSLRGLVPALGLSVAFVALASLLAPVSKARAFGVVVEPETPFSSAGYTPRSVAVIGDSLSSGILADTQMGGYLTKSDASKIMRAMFDFVRNGGTLTYDDLQSRFGRADLSAFGGTRAYSHPERLKQKFGLSQLPVFNVAKAGAVVGDVPGQVSKLAAIYGHNPSARANYLVFAMGDNDFCFGNDLESFRTQYRDGLSLALTLHPDAKVVVMPLFDFPTLERVSAASEIAIRLWTPIYEKPVTCGQIRSITPFCKHVFPSLTEQAATQDAMNAVIQETVDELRPRFSGEITVATGISTPDQIRPELLGADCMHPSQAGQARIADITWTAAWGR